jgi:hypothetical protein
VPQFVIEREISGAGNLGKDELRKITKHSCQVLADMRQEGSDIEWVHSYVAGDKIYCVYNSKDEQAIREHAKRGGFPANRITPVADVISPTYAS